MAAIHQHRAIFDDSMHRSLRTMETIPEASDPENEAYPSRKGRPRTYQDLHEDPYRCTRLTFFDQPIRRLGNEDARSIKLILDMEHCHLRWNRKSHQEPQKLKRAKTPQVFARGAFAH